MVGHFESVLRHSIPYLPVAGLDASFFDSPAVPLLDLPFTSAEELDELEVDEEDDSVLSDGFGFEPFERGDVLKDNNVFTLPLRGSYCGKHKVDRRHHAAWPLDDLLAF